MRRLIAMLLPTCTSLGHAQTEPCIPDLNPTALAKVSVASQHCGLRLQSYQRESGAELTGSVTIGIDDRDAIRIVQNIADPPFALVQTGNIIGAGRNGDLSTGESGAWMGRWASPRIGSTNLRAKPAPCHMWPAFRRGHCRRRMEWFATD